jgi:hypothetical protein
LLFSNWLWSMGGFCTRIIMGPGLRIHPFHTRLFECIVRGCLTVCGSSLDPSKYRAQ